MTVCIIDLFTNVDLIVLCTNRLGLILTRSNKYWVMLQWRGRLVCPHRRSESGLINKYIAQHCCKKSHNRECVSKPETLQSIKARGWQNTGAERYWVIIIESTNKQGLHHYKINTPTRYNYLYYFIKWNLSWIKNWPSHNIT